MRLSPLALPDRAAELHLNHRDDFLSAERAPAWAQGLEPVEPRLLAVLSRFSMPSVAALTWSGRLFSPPAARPRPIEEIRPGDVVWFSPGEKHWHGAAPTTAMTHIAVQEKLDGKAVDWMEKVSDEQYRG